MALPSTPTIRVFAACVKSRTPLLFWGPPGVGKSALIEAYAKAWAYHCATVIGSVREPSDYLGLPVEVDGRVVYSPPAWAVECNEADQALLFLDELSTASPTVQKANLRLMQERFAGDLRLRDSVAIIAAANPPEEAADGWDLPAPVANRLVHLDWHFDMDAWFDGILTDFDSAPAFTLEALLGNGGTDVTRATARGRISAFLRHNANWLNPKVPTDPVLAGQAWPSPRSWHNATTILGELDPTDDAAMLLAVKGCVGDDAARAFFVWMATADLHDPSEVMKNPSIVTWHEERPDRLFALTTSITALVLSRNTDEAYTQGIAALTACALGQRPDVALPGMRSLLSTLPKGVGIKPETRNAFADLFSRTGQWAA